MCRVKWFAHLGMLQGCTVHTKPIYPVQFISWKWVIKTVWHVLCNTQGRHKWVNHLYLHLSVHWNMGAYRNTTPGIHYINHARPFLPLTESMLSKLTLSYVSKVSYSEFISRTLLAFVDICLFIIGKWVPLSDRLLWVL